jgi:quinol monooxygenase YgiN
MNVAVIVVAVIRAKPSMTQQVLDAFAEVSPVVHEEPGCELYAAHSDGTAVVMVERWASKQDLEAHSSGAPLKRLGELIGPALEQAPEVWTLDEVPLGDPGKGSIPVPAL